MTHEFKKWMEAYGKASCQVDADYALDKMADFAESFDDWRNVFYRADSGTVFENMAFLQMATRAKTFGQWLNVFTEAPDEYDVKLVAMKQMMKLADDPKDADSWVNRRDCLMLPRWQKIFDLSQSNSIDESTSAKRIMHFLVKEKQRKLERKADRSITKI